MAGLADDPVHLHVGSSAGVDGVPRGLGAAEDRDSFLRLEDFALVLP